MKDDIKSKPNNQSQFTASQPNNSKTIDGVSPPAVSSQTTNHPNPPVENTQAKPAEENIKQPTETIQKKPQTAAKPPEAPKPKKNRRAIPIILAVIVLLGLSSLAVYGGLMMNDKTNGTGNNQSQQQTESQKTDNRQEIQETIKQIDSLPEETDTSGDNLTDQKLGL